MQADLKQRMEGALTALTQEFAGLRTGRASTELLNPIKIDAYGQETPLNQVGNIAVADARMLTVQVWDKTMVAAVEKGIRDAGLGLNPAVDGQMIRIPMPELNEERRKELVKMAKQYAEQSRIAIRNVRRDGMDKIKHSQKENEFSEDEAKQKSDEVQKLTDDFVSKVDSMLGNKETDILKV